MSETPVVMSDALSTMTSVTDAADIVANAPESIASLFEFGERLVYGTFYSATFVIVFPVALLFTALPKGNPMSRGLINGASDAWSRADCMIG